MVAGKSLEFKFCCTDINEGIDFFALHWANHLYVSPASFLGATEPNLAEMYLRVFCQVPHKRLSVQRARFTASFDVNPGILNIKYNIVYMKLGIGYSYDKSFFPFYFIFLHSGCVSTRAEYCACLVLCSNERKYWSQYSQRLNWLSIPDWEF